MINNDQATEVIDKYKLNIQLLLYFSKQKEVEPSSNNINNSSGGTASPVHTPPRLHMSPTSSVT